MKQHEVNEILKAQRDITIDRNVRQGLTDERAERLVPLGECATILKHSQIITERLLGKRVENFYHMQYVNGRDHARCDYNRSAYLKMGVFTFINWMNDGRLKHAA